MSKKDEKGAEEIFMKMYEKHSYCKEKENNRLYKIGMFAQMNHITVKTLRFYEEQGLLVPAYVDEENGYRYYTMNQMAELHQISALKQAGFTLEDIVHLKNGADENAFLSRKRAELLSKIAELTKQIAVIDGYMTDASSSIEAPVLVKTIPAVIAATMQKRIESYDALFEMMPSMGAEMERLGCECAVPEYCFTHYLEPGYKEEQILVETCEAVTEKKEDSKLVKFKEFPEIQAACIFHKGSYNDFPQTYAAILTYIEENGYEICGNIRENYIDGVWNKDSEEEWLSEIQIPVRKR
ncbi:MAG: MerR family transcriptional regulator [Thermoflexaceae bacterium]|nr:MerR family transcriptional regulator [Thermoflexaceae bacterium]